MSKEHERTPADAEQTQLSAPHPPPADMERTQPSAPRDAERTRPSGVAPDATQLSSVHYTGGTVVGSASGEQAGTIKERFVLQERLGKGGMGQVFRAIDLRKQEAEDDDPFVAIKFLGEEFSRHPQALISLQREAKKTQALAHPNILTVYDFDRDGSRVYMTMELLQGGALSDWRSILFDEGCEPTPAFIITELARGLAYAHARGLVHSDLKPDNVFVTRDGRVKILDFGIARIVETAASTDTWDAGSLGALTVRYASLEMLEGGEEPHPADDVYALGLIAYQLFAGKHAYDGASAIDALERGLSPERPKGLKGYQWRAIADALALRRADRTASAEVFLRQFTGSRRRKQMIAGTVLVLALSSSYLGWLSTQREGPSIPFTELPAATQQAFRNSVEMGRRSLQISDWDGASRYFMQAYELHPRNAQAEEGLEAILDQIESRVQDDSSLRQKAFVMKLLDSYAEHPYFAESRRFRSLRAQLSAQIE